MALTKGNQAIERRSGLVRTLGVLAAVQCFQGGIAIAVAGLLRPGRTGVGVDNAAKAADAATYRCVGAFSQSVLGGAADGDVVAEVENNGWYLLKNSATDPVAAADLENVVYIEDDETIAKTAGAGTVRAKAGRLKAVTSGGVFVRLGHDA